MSGENISSSPSNNGDKKFFGEAPFMSDTLKGQLHAFPEVVDYIEMLEKIIKKQKRKLKRIKAKFKVRKQTSLGMFWAY